MKSHREDSNQKGKFCIVISACFSFRDTKLLMLIQNFNNNLEQILKNYKSKEVNSNENYLKLTKMNKDKFSENTSKEKLIHL